MSESKKARRSSDDGENEAKEGQGAVIGSMDNFKPGQRYMTPSPGDGQRVFYETLLEQRPDSQMARDWCIAYGILDEAKAKKLTIKSGGAGAVTSKSPAAKK
jgi:hypothetical protein